ncbi:Methyltransferase domain-containing protein [Bowdeniella nasicola]|uniref:Methyltransferase domain-containing protein n=2 Tax=Bowdeniella nasicola TaxID=208480 RepID=A0A1H3WWT9_9ACTO|nr:Methyltransferase domain-containing protein [Bowdeniella nasicola]
MGDMTDQARWQRITSANPEHSARYIDRFKQLAARGFDLHGEARAADALVARGALIIDAGCGPGRVAIELAKRGHRVIGLDIDPEFVAEGTTVAADAGVGLDPAVETEDISPGQVRFIEANICEPVPMDVPKADLIVCAGNVITFLDGESPADFLTHIGNSLAPGGRMVIGFGLRRGYSLARYEGDLASSGWVSQSRFSTWQFEPFGADSDFLVDILSRT